MRKIHSIDIRDEAEIGAARRAVHEYARDLGFNDTELAEIDIVVQEIGTNAVSYATNGGSLHFTTPLESAAFGLELFYWDKGPGVYDLERAVADGVSTGNSLGAGLGAIQRLTNEFEVYSMMRTTKRLTLSSARRTTHGTALLARKWATSATRERDVSDSDVTSRIGVWSRPHPGEELNGDGYFVRTRDAQTLLAVIDGLGHGHGAHQATSLVLELLDEWTGEPIDEVLVAAHEALRATRGAVMGAMVIDREHGYFHYAGVGNILVRAYNAPEHASAISTNGTLGARLGRVRVWTNKWAEETIIIMASDGVSASWDMDAYPGLLQKSPQLVAGVLMRDYQRIADDATVLVAR